MAKSNHWAFPSDMQPKAEDVRFDLASTLRSVVMLRAEIPDDAYTAEILGTERFGNGVVIRDDGLILTIGYLTTEADSIWLTANDGTVVPGHALGYDFASGFGLVLPLGRLNVPPVPIGTAATLAEGDDVFVIGRGGRAHALAARIFAKREFAGYWEYVLDEALFTTPAHPEWSGAALIDGDGRLAGIGSLFVQEMVGDEEVRGNMFVPIDLIVPIMEDMVKRGRPTAPPRPWLGMYTVETQGRLVVNSLADKGPAEVAGVRAGDVVTEVAGQRVEHLADLFRAIWRKGPAGTGIPLMLVRDGAPFRVTVRSADRTDFFRKPSLQ